MNEQPLDLRRMARAIWRQRVRFLACAAIGLLLGVAVAVAAPPPYTARALVLLPASGLDASGTPTRDVQTQVHIASSSDVLSLAARAIRPATDVADLRGRVHVSAPTPDLLQFQAHAPSKQFAEAIADQVAAAYVQWSQQGTSDLVSKVVATLRTQAHALDLQASDLQTQIDAATTALARMNPAGAAAADEQAHLDALRAQQGNVSSQLLNLNSQISDVQLSSAVANSGTSVLQRASGASSGFALTWTRDLGAGLLIGMLGGAALALAFERRDRRLRRRDDIARAAGVPTIASVTAAVARGAKARLELMAHYEPGLDASFGLRWILRHLLAAHDDVPARVTVVLLPDDEAAHSVPLLLAAFSARAGVRTVLVDGSTARGIDASEPALPNLWLANGRTQARAIERGDAQLVIGTLAAGGPLEAAEPDHPGTTLLAVSAGFATSDTLATVALNTTESGRALLGVVVANPEPRDDSTGREPHELDEPRPVVPLPLTPSHRAGGSA